MLPIGGTIVPVKNPLQQLARLFIDPYVDYSFYSQRAQAKIQCSILSMYESYSCPKSLITLLKAVQKKSGRVYICPERLCPTDIKEDVINRMGFEFKDGKMSKIHAKYISSNNLLCRDIFDVEYGPLVDIIIEALVNDQPTYEIPDRYSASLCTKGKWLHEAKYSNIAQTYHMDNRLIRGKDPVNEELTQDQKLITLNSVEDLANIFETMSEDTKTMEEVLAAIA